MKTVFEIWPPQEIPEKQEQRVLHLMTKFHPPLAQKTQKHSRALDFPCTETERAQDHPGYTHTHTHTRRHEHTHSLPHQPSPWLPFPEFGLYFHLRSPLVPGRDIFCCSSSRYHHAFLPGISQSLSITARNPTARQARSSTTNVARPGNSLRRRARGACAASHSPLEGALPGRLRAEEAGAREPRAPRGRASGSRAAPEP